MNKEESRLKKWLSFLLPTFFPGSLLPGVAALPETSGRFMLCAGPQFFLCRLFPGRGILHATYRHARATVDVDYVYLVAFRESRYW